MNQIIEHTPNKGSGGNSGRTDKIVRVFFIFIILFAIILVGGGAFRLIKNKKTEEVQVASTPSSKAKISIDEENDNGDITISVENDKPIDVVYYNWDTRKQKEVKGTGESTLTFDIPSIAGEHDLNIKVVSDDGEETIKSKKITSNSGEDKMNPTIEPSVIVDEESGERKIKIVAKDETALDYVTYRWNDEEETKIEASEDNEKTIEFNIDIYKGSNDLVVIAVDKNKNNATFTHGYTGVTKPVVKIVVAEDKKSVNVTCTHENGLKDISVTVNSQLYQIEIEEGQKDASFDVPLEEGKNKIVVKAGCVDNLETIAEDEIINETVVEDEIKIDIKNNETNEELGYAEITTSGKIKDVKLNVNNQDYSVPVPAEEPAGLNFDFEIPERTNIVKITVTTENGTQKTEKKELTRLN